MGDITTDAPTKVWNDVNSLCGETKLLFTILFSWCWFFLPNLSTQTNVETMALVTKNVVFLFLIVFTKINCVWFLINYNNSNWKIMHKWKFHTNFVFQLIEKKKFVWKYFHTNIFFKLIIKKRNLYENIFIQIYCQK